MRSGAPLTADRLRELLDYDPLTGFFVRRRASGPVAAGSVAGSVNRVSGYMEISVDGKTHLAQRLAWLHTYGSWPTKPLRMIDGCRTNCAIRNLREWSARPPITSLPVEAARARVDELLVYDAQTGSFTSRADRLIWSAGQRVGTVEAGYLLIGIDGKQIQAHRLAWLLTHGKWPDHEIDHIDGNGLNNAIANLRDVPHAINMQNVRAARADSRSALIGAHYRPDTGRFSSRIRTAAGVLPLGSFDTAAEAHEAYVDAKRQHHAGGTL